MITNSDTGSVKCHCPLPLFSTVSAFTVSISILSVYLIILEFFTVFKYNLTKFCGPSKKILKFVDYHHKLNEN